MKRLARRSSLLLLSVGVFAAVAMLAVACGGDDDNTSKAPAQATTATSPAASTAATTGGKTAYPVDVTDLLGRKVTIKAKPNIVVGLSPTAVELVYAVGGTVAGRTASVDFPEAAKQAKDVGSAYQPSADAILALKPDLVVADSVIQAQPDLKKQLEALGVPVVFAGADSYQKVLDGLKLMGTILDAQAKAQEQTATIQKALADAKAAIGGKTVSGVALIADRDQTLYAAKPSSYAGDVLQQLGITNPAASQPDAGPFPGYTALAPEKMVQYDPDFIFAITPAPAPAPRLSTLIPQIPPFKGLKAVTGKHVVEADVQLFLQAPGPRVVDAFKAIAAAVKGQ